MRSGANPAGRRGTRKLLVSRGGRGSRLISTNPDANRPQARMADAQVASGGPFGTTIRVRSVG